MSTSSWQVQHTLAALRWGHGSQWLLSAKTRAGAIGARIPKMSQWLWNLLMKQETSSGVLPRLEVWTHLPPLASEWHNHQQSCAMGWALEKQQGWFLVPACIFIHLKITLQKLYKQSRRRCRPAELLVVSPSLVSAVFVPAMLTWPGGWLPVLGSLCWGSVPNPNLACSSSGPQNVPSTWQIFLQQSCKCCECATPPTSIGASENIKGVCEDVKIPISPYSPYPPYFTDFLCAGVH